jgi:hypothetical protein
MRFGTPARLFAALGFGLALLLSSPALCSGAPAAEQAKDKDKEKGAEDKEKRVTFKTVDGVELGGTYYKPPKEGAKDACVLLLHDFSKQKGGDSHQDDLDKLAELLQGEGYAVLSFDFRGHGQSKSVQAEVFWNTGTNRHNLQALPNKIDPKSPPTSIDQKNFLSAYYLHLINDVSAAKSFLDRKTFAKEPGVNSANLIVIGAGQGATIGAMWTYAQYHLVRQKGTREYDEPEGRDIICTVWLSMSPEVEGVRVPVTTYLEDLEKKFKVPMVFLYGADDKASEERSLKWLRDVMPDYKQMGAKGLFNQDKDKALKYTRDLAVEGTKLSGGKLLTSDLRTAENVKVYLEEYLKDRGGMREARRVEVDKFPYFWMPRNNIGTPLPAKVIGEENVKTIPLKVIYLGQ